MNKVILFLGALILVSSCNQSEKSKIEGLEKKNELQIKIVINAKVLVDDVFEVYYYEPGQEGFHPQDFVSSKVKGSMDYQDIEFDLPEKTYPERLRLDFGKNINQKQIILSSVKFSYGEKEYSYGKNEIINDFKPSKYLILDNETLTLTPNEIDNKYDPYLYSKRITNIVNYLMED